MRIEDSDCLIGGCVQGILARSKLTPLILKGLDERLGRLRSVVSRRGVSDARPTGKSRTMRRMRT